MTPINESISALPKDHEWNPSINFDLWNNGNEISPSPFIDVKYQGKAIASTTLPSKEAKTTGGYRQLFTRWQCLRYDRFHLPLH